MEVFRVRYINKENKEITVVTVVHTNAHNAIEMATLTLEKMGFKVSEEKQEIICDIIQTETPQIVSFVLP